MSSPSARKPAEQARFWRNALVLGLALTAAAFMAAGEPALAAPQAPRKVEIPSAIAVGDIHGDFKTFRKLLLDAGLIDERERWVAGPLHLIQTGDVVDRGPESRRVLDLLMRLENEAAAAGGKVVVTMGNHELWNLIGEHYYVCEGEYAAFAAEESPELRETKRRAILALIEKPHPLLRSRYYQGLAAAINERTFDQVFPRGSFAHRAAFSPDGHYGRWLMKRPIVHVDHKILFVHAGISPRYSGATADAIHGEARALIADYFRAVRALEALGVYDSGFGWEALGLLIRRERATGAVNSRLESHFRAIESFNAGMLMEENGPLMYRGLAIGDERLLAADLKRVLATHGVERIVIGHTQPRSLNVEVRFDNRVVLIDTGLNQAVYKGQPSLLTIYANGDLGIFAD